MTIELINTLQQFLDSYEPNCVIPTLDSLFGDHTPAGEFTWKSGEAGDWYPEYDSDTKTWTKIAYAINIGRRKNNARWIEVMSCDADGNWDCLYGYDEETDGEFASTAHEFIFALGGQEDYFKAWAEYWLDCVETQQDPLGQCFQPDYTKMIESNTWTELCLNAAKINISSLTGGKEFLQTLSTVK